jgi:hypothetical protein
LHHLKAQPHAREFILPQAAGAFDAQGRIADPQLSAELADVIAGFSHALQGQAELAA